jgi:hypothetical protein
MRERHCSLLAPAISVRACAVCYDVQQKNLAEHARSLSGFARGERKPERQCDGRGDHDESHDYV